jgi:aspartate/methionine/tyrosine aminotransferase
MARQPTTAARQPTTAARQPTTAARQPTTAASQPTTAARLDGIVLSPIRRMHVGAPSDALSLGLGEPAWPLPATATEALSAPRAGCSYGPNQGLPELRSALSIYYGRPAEEIMVTAGSQAALFAIFQAWLGPGTVVLVPDPGFLAYPILARLAGAEPLCYPLAADGCLDAETFVTALDTRPEIRMAIINHPANPTGGGASQQALAKVAAACQSRGVLLISDEVYRELYTSERTPSLADVSDWGLVLSSASKAWGAPGLRVGWALGDPAILEPARLIHNYMNTAAARPSQEATAALINDSQRILPAARAAILERRQALESALHRELGLRAPPSAGGFYCWLPLPSQALVDPLAYCLRIRDEGKVIIVPGMAFGPGGQAHVRISYAGPPADIQEGIRRLAPFWRA